MDAITVIVCILAGMGAGIGTGFAGLSAAVFIAPMLVVFTGTPVYHAVGIALASDVLASAFSAVIYARKGNIEVKNSVWLLVTVLAFCVLGSILAFVITKHEVGNAVMGYWSIVMSIVMGVQFLFFPPKICDATDRPDGKKKTLLSVGSGALIGSVCGFQGTGGGMMLLFVLNTLLRFEHKSAVGTSVFIMTFVALIGAASHFVAIQGFPDVGMLLICMASTLVFAVGSAFLANRLKTKTLNIITGTLLAVTGVAMLIFNIFTPA